MSAIVATPPGAAQEPQSAEHVMRLCTGYMASISVNIDCQAGDCRLAERWPADNRRTGHEKQAQMKTASTA